MRIRGIISAIVGLVQSAIGVLTAVLTGLLFLGIYDLQTIFDFPPELFPFCFFILGLFSFFSIISGVLLIRDLRR